MFELTPVPLYVPPAGVAPVKATVPEFKQAIPNDGTVTTGIVEPETFTVAGALDPQPLFAVTVIRPVVLDAVAVITQESEIPDQPDGSVHV